MDGTILERTMIRATKNYLKKLTKSLSKEIISIRKNADYIYIEIVDNTLGYDWDYFEKKYFNEESLKEKCIKETGYFNYSELCEEVDEFIKVYVWHRAYIELVDEGELK